MFERRRTSFAALHALVACSLLLLSGCNRIENRSFVEWRLKHHFNQHADAFDALTKKIQSDDSYVETTYCDPSATGFFAMSESDDSVKKTEYEPFLKALDFPECVFASKWNNGGIWVPNAGHAKHGDFEIEYAYSFHPLPPEPERTCQSVTRSIEGELCYIPLENDWYLDEIRVNVRLIRIEVEAKLACKNADTEDLDCEAVAKAAGENYIRQHQR
jgi:hypothetical protein